MSFLSLDASTFLPEELLFGLLGAPNEWHAHGVPGREARGPTLGKRGQSARCRRLWSAPFSRKTRALPHIEVFRTSFKALKPQRATSVYTIHTCIHTYIDTYTHTYIHTCIHTYIHKYVHTYIHTYIHTYLHTYIRSICPHTDILKSTVHLWLQSSLCSGPSQVWLFRRPVPQWLTLAPQGAWNRPPRAVPRSRKRSCCRSCRTSCQGPSGDLAKTLSLILAITRPPKTSSSRKKHGLFFKETGENEENTHSS